MHAALLGGPGGRVSTNEPVRTGALFHAGASAHGHTFAGHEGVTGIGEHIPRVPRDSPPRGCSRLRSSGREACVSVCESVRERVCMCACVTQRKVYLLHARGGFAALGGKARRGSGGGREGALVSQRSATNWARRGSASPRGGHARSAACRNATPPPPATTATTMSGRRLQLATTGRPSCALRPAHSKNPMDWSFGEAARRAAHS